jgi:hypothetical protein
VAYTKVKTRYIAETSIERFLLTHRNVYFWTFTEPGNEAGVLRKCWTKTQAEAHVKPFLDLLRRRGAEYLLVWELQKRVSWHPHILTDVRLDVNFVRPWLVARGWGQQMRVEWVVRGGRAFDKFGNLSTSQDLVGYLTKKLRSYLLKARTDDSVEPRKKFFGGTHRSKVGTVKFSWNPYTDTAHSMLYFYGRALFVEMLGYVPSAVKLRNNMPVIMALGCEDRNWLDVDFLYEPPFS